MYPDRRPAPRSRRARRQLPAGRTGFDAARGVAGGGSGALRTAPADAQPGRAGPVDTRSVDSAPAVQLPGASKRATWPVAALPAPGTRFLPPPISTPNRHSDARLGVRVTVWQPAQALTRCRSALAGGSLPISAARAASPAPSSGPPAASQPPRPRPAGPGRRPPRPPSVPARPAERAGRPVLTPTQKLRG